ncbi:DMT family transporter [Paracoccus sediminis]|uniref:DMT family transporter n=1 Tax=Paracoccus sediminis TaxID=1214787 RepID=A0A238USM8_9RHOB|nr:DMT family transporter [Paracoccus sediminis]TBN52896.1 DMT family transporter [Paracoccus sediminis]SNR24697.1 EamA-like transporter family protein [Paracoccus sediminis]
MHNLRAAILMVVAMAAFAAEDALLKGLSGGVPTGQLLAVVGFGGMVVFALWVALGPEGMRPRNLLRPAVMLRNLCEGVCAITFVTALATGDLSVASAILQAQPLLMTLGAALFLGEQVGWRRWLSIAAGFVGVLMIVKPGTAAFEFSSVLAIIAVMTLAVRDLVTRRLPPEVGSGLLSAGAFGSMGIAGLALMILGGQEGVAPSAGQGALMAATLGFGIAGYITMVIATRIAEIAVIAPFRYSRLLFALLLAVTIFGERPDALTLAGAALIAGAGIYSMWREARLRRARLVAA